MSEAPASGRTSYAIAAKLHPMKFFVLCALTLSALIAHAAPAPKTLPPATQTEIERLLHHPGLQSGRIGLAIVALGEADSPAQFPARPYDDGAQPLLFGHDETKRFTPASNFKLFTAAWALKTLGPKARFETRVLGSTAEFLDGSMWPATEKPPHVITLIGGGDPSLSSGDLEDLARQALASVKGEKKGFWIVRAQDSPEGALFNAETGGRRYPDGWTLDDAIWYYGPPVTGLAINRNQVDVTVKGAAQAGDLALIESAPTAPFQILSTVITVAPNDPRASQLQWDRGDLNSPLGPTLWLRGFIGVDAKATEGIAVPDPKNWARTLLASDIKAGGGQIAELNGGYTTPPAEVIATHQSPPLNVLLRQFLKQSDNLYGEMLLRRAGATLNDDAPLVPGVTISSTGLAARAHRDMAVWLRESGVPVEGLRFSDGSGLSRYDLATPLAIARLLGTVQKLDGGADFYNALPIAGVDGTLKNRFKGSAAQGNLHAKTGTFSITNCLSGYVTTRDGQRLAVSILTNFVEDGEVARNWQGRVMATLAAASWKTP